ncbi:glucosaminidase domain-containing protein [Limosilactobacillus fermentum]|nr:glucosaminidase domain-containing protein [Limosilactobacillus fermentum]
MVAAATSTKNGLVTENGATYYYINGVKQTNYFLGQNGKMYYFGSDGKEYKDQFYYNWGNMYYFGNDGARYTDQFYYNWGNMYYFGDDGVRYTNQFYSNWGKMYYFGDDGVRYTNRFYSNWGKMYYFGDDGARYTNQFYSNWGNMYYFGSDGARYTDQFYSNWGKMYYFGDDGVRWTNQFMSAWGNIYYFGSDGSRATSTTINLGYGDLTFDSNGVLTNTNSFIGSIVNGAIDGWLNYKILPSLTIAQAILESAWGQSTLASQYHNLFGIKGSYNGSSVSMLTAEVYNGVTQYIYDYFRAYPNNDASVNDHALFLVENSRYANLIGNTSASSVTTLIRQDGYATDPNYSSSLMTLINTYGLTKYDQIAFSAKSM